MAVDTVRMTVKDGHELDRLDIIVAVWEHINAVNIAVETARAPVGPTVTTGTCRRLGSMSATVPIRSLPVDG